MTQEALKLALDALETELSIDWTNNDEFNTSAEKMYKAIDAIKKALAQRTWVGLAAEDRLCAKYMQDAPEGIEAVIDYIEDKLKELNNV